MRIAQPCRYNTIEEHVDRLEAKFGSQDELVRELRDAVTVTAELEARQSRALRQHGEWLEAHERSIAEHDREMREARERGKLLDERIANLVSGFGEFLRRADNR